MLLEGKKVSAEHKQLEEQFLQVELEFLQERLEVIKSSYLAYLVVINLNLATI